MMNKLKSAVIWLAGVTLLTQVAVAALPLPWLDDDNQMPTLAPMLDQSKPAVVNIATRSEVRIQDNPLLNDPFFRRFFNLPQQQQPRTRQAQSLGSGVIVNAKEGLVLTNNHVIQRADEITVSLHDGRTFQAEVVGSDPATDVAVIRIPPEKLTALPLADSDRLRVGDFVVAIGNPFGLGQTVTSGIVSALGRSGLGLEGYENFIQTDASINPGNSGGALVNLRGELVGINTAIFSPNQSGNVGIGFAIPSNLVKQITDQLLEYGEVRRAYLGVQMQDITPELAQAFGIEDNRGGAVVTNVIKDSAAEKAGLKVGDVVTAVDGVSLLNADNLRNTIGLLMVGQTIKLDIIRNGKEKTLTAKVTEVQSSKTQTGDVHPKLRGATFGDIEQSSPAYGRIQGIMLYSVERGSPAWVAGLRSYDIVTSVNRQPVANLEQFKQLVSNQPELLLNIVRDNQAMFLLLR
ncbi:MULTISPECIES: DegQ family serine endoprotease [unclassified Methylophaga]|jgi:Do/DeqQ family serine protease|uniref:DegQ family serine endoprotease n=1 Tax=unclassified Methylophaga TaxID=2629249 RepID=UPI000C60FCA6|nr:MULTISPECIES: DegQ family serine endoprotease [unclassified Methylophaga]MBP25614.1 serine endoprotease DegQ [Methylophaga sp.]HCC80307.1 serine endoprotease DegQ [Methylophaga sp.]|tara:strand:- start:1789 stop:3174 length:1386 start_codon:yes stop_codon:yes gene_type:complete